jgi:hypothetical protein
MAWAGNISAATAWAEPVAISTGMASATAWIEER